MVGVTKQMRFQSPIILNVKITKKHNGNFMGPNKNQKQFKGKKGPYFVCRKPRHCVRECRYRKDKKWAIVNEIFEEIIATLSNI